MTAVAYKQTTGTASASSTPMDTSPSTTTVPEPTGRPTVAAVVTVTAAANDSAVAPVASGRAVTCRGCP